jgi:chemotaxis receptor (MCP) glutamine deamidase CheD
MSDKMFNNSEKYFLHPGYIFISRNPYLIHTVLGSCVAVCLNEIEIITTDVGGQTGRKVIFDSGSGRIIVYKGINIRQDDWYNRYEK